MAGNTFVPTATIAINAALSSAVDTRYMAVVGLVTPGTWTAAGIAFHVSYDGGSTYAKLAIIDHSSAPAGLDVFEILAADVPAGAARYISLDPIRFLGATHVKINSQTAGSDVNQGGARTLTLVLRDMGA